MDVELHLEQLAVKLDVCARKARERMGLTRRQLLQTFSNEAEHKTWLHALLKELATVVDSTARGNGDGSEKRHLYLWPGYDSILFGRSRIGFEVDMKLREKLTVLGYENGLSREGARSMQTGAIFPAPKEPMVDRAGLYFDAALAPVLPAEADRRNTFSVGGTHNWLGLSPTAEGEPLIGFEVRTTSGPHSSHRSFPTILLDPSRPFEWGSAVAVAVHAACGDSPRSFWPLPIRRPGESHQDYGERLVIEHASAGNRSIRQRLYSLWLIGCCVSDPGGLLLENGGLDWTEQLIRDLRPVDPGRANRIENLLELERNLAAGSALPIGPTCFDRWGVLTIPYPIADAREGEEEESDELGSGMLLANFDLPCWYYFVIRQWIASYYLSLRQQESSVARAEHEAQKAALKAQSQLRRQLSHAVGLELTYLEFLATVARGSLDEAHFEPSAERLAAGVAYLRNGKTELDVAFASGHGMPTPVEESLVRLMLEATGDDPLRRDVSLVERSLAAVPAREGRRVMTALAEEVRRIAVENEALVRVDDESVKAAFEAGPEPAGDANAVPLVRLLCQALIVAFTVYFRKAFPPDQSAPEMVCGQSADALFGDADADVVERRTVGQACAREWRKFVADAFRAHVERPDYATVLSSLQKLLEKRSRLRLELPEPDDSTRLARGCGEYTPPVLQAWMAEALLNALKHSRPADDPQLAIIRLAWQTNAPFLTISNTTDLQRAKEAVAAVNAARNGASTLKEGHQGLAFLCYAASHLFRDSHLHAREEPAAQMLLIEVT